MRASMSIPAVMTPVEIDGRLLIDGGLARHLPVDVALGMGAERIIAVDVGTPPRAAGPELSALGVYSQTFNVLSKGNVKAQLELLGEDDVLIVPDLSEIRPGDFDEFANAVEAGHAAARAMAPQLRQFSVSEEEFDQFLARQRVETSFEAPDVTVDSIEVRGIPGIRP
jgi:NTE family protein